MLMAQQHYVEQGSDQVSLNKLEAILPGYVITADKPLEFWQKMVTEAEKKVSGTVGHRGKHWETDGSTFRVTT